MLRVKACSCLGVGVLVFRCARLQVCLFSRRRACIQACLWDSKVRNEGWRRNKKHIVGQGCYDSIRGAGYEGDGAGGGEGMGGVEQKEERINLTCGASYRLVNALVQCTPLEMGYVRRAFTASRAYSLAYFDIHRHGTPPSPTLPTHPSKTMKMKVQMPALPTSSPPSDTYPLPALPKPSQIFCSRTGRCPSRATPTPRSIRSLPNWRTVLQQPHGREADIQICVILRTYIAK